jgi:hypothetical protein
VELGLPLLRRLGLNGMLHCNTITSQKRDGLSVKDFLALNDDSIFALHDGFSDRRL